MQARESSAIKENYHIVIKAIGVISRTNISIEQIEEIQGEPLTGEFSVFSVVNNCCNVRMRCP